MRNLLGSLLRQTLTMLLIFALLTGVLLLPVTVQAVGGILTIVVYDSAGNVITDQCQFSVLNVNTLNKGTPRTSAPMGPGIYDVDAGTNNIIMTNYPAGKTFTKVVQLAEVGAGESVEVEFREDVAFTGTQSSEYPFILLPSATEPAFYCNTYCNLDFALKDVSGKNLTIQEVILDSAADAGSFPFTINQTRIWSYTPEKKIVTMGAESIEAYVINFGQLFVRENVVDGYYTLNFTIRYKVQGDITNNLYEQKLSYQIRVFGKPEEKKDQRFLLSPYSIPTQTGTYGQYMNLQFGIINRGFDVADVISITPVISNDASQWPFEIEAADYTVAVDRQLWPVAAGQSPSETNGTLILVWFPNLHLRQKLTSGYKKIDLKIKFKYGSQAIQEEVLSTYVNVKGNPEEDGKADHEDGRQSVPRLICTGFETNPPKVMGGENFKLTLKLKNTSSKTAIQNIRVVLSSAPAGDEGEPFITASGASSVFIPSIAPDSEHILEVDMVSSVKVPQKAYPLSIKMEYEDAEATPISGEESISIQLYQKVRLDVGKIEVMPPQLTVGQEGNVMFPLYNKGKTKLYNVTVIVPEGQGLSGSEAYIGNVEPGATAQVDMMVKADEPFDIEPKRKLIVRYEDENGVPSDKEVELELSAMDQPEGMDGMPPGFDPGMGGMVGEDGMMGPDGTMEGGPHSPLLPLWGWIAIAVGSGLIFIISIALVVRKKRRKKKMAMEDEAYFQDMLRRG